MRLGTISQHPQSGTFLVLEDEQRNHMNPNSKLISATNIDVSKLEKHSFGDLETLGLAMYDITLAQILEQLGEHDSQHNNLESFKDKFEMCHRGLVPVNFFATDFSTVTVLSFSDHKPEEFHITRFFKIGGKFEHSFDLQGANLHIAYPTLLAQLQN
ncbi:hypothetical protein OTK49_28440 [Vibrio coralliirubri]|uniref:hypothetical protein n=1 Tax=Vibrio coralliirubri TaxID=1516159 RepID=UPI0022833D96|nr:hypothetical protein [Vibrio coralliirubri]MCY9866473.1 hypothetical protein [Vibrio coralliirubri]